MNTKGNLEEIKKVDYKKKKNKKTMEGLEMWGKTQEGAVSKHFNNYYFFLTFFCIFWHLYDVQPSLLDFYNLIY